MLMIKKDYAGRLPLLVRIVLILLPAVCFAVCLCCGRMVVPLGDVWQAFLALLGIGEPIPLQTAMVLGSMRAPRLLLAALAGAGLSAAGCTFQSLFANPLATPDTLGVASGSAFGAAFALLLGFGMIGVQISAFFFGLLAVMLTALAGYGLASRHTPILAGIMVGSLFTALISLVKFTADTESQLPAITYWLMGSMESAGYRSLLFGAPPILIGIAVLFCLRWRMNLLPLSEDEAISTGVRLKTLRIICEGCATLITASCVSLCGQVGWVGLLIPHLCRMAFGNNHVSLLPASVSLGAVFMMAVDTAARTLSPKEIPLSVLTALLGAPFFLWLLRKNRGWGV